LRIAYDQWTQFETFPQFMDGVEQVTQVDDTTLNWRARIAGITREWEARISEQTPNERIAGVRRPAPGEARSSAAVSADPGRHAIARSRGRIVSGGDPART